MSLEILKTNPEKHPFYANSDVGHQFVPLIEHFISQASEDDVNLRFNFAKTLKTALWWTHMNVSCFPFHIPHDHIPNIKGKFIVIARNPKSTISSLFLFQQKVEQSLLERCMKSEGDKVSFESFLSYFLRGLNVYGCYFEFHNEWWSFFKKMNGLSVDYMIKNDDEVDGLNEKNGKMLWLYYENMVDNPKKYIEMIAKFLGENKMDIVDEIAQKTGFSSMKESLEKNPGSCEFGSMIMGEGKKNGWKDLFEGEVLEREVEETMFLRWAQSCSDIKYYRELMQSFEEYDKGYLGEKLG